MHDVGLPQRATYLSAEQKDISFLRAGKIILYYKQTTLKKLLPFLNRNEQIYFILFAFLRLLCLSIVQFKSVWCQIYFIIVRAKILPANPWVLNI